MLIQPVVFVLIQRGAQHTDATPDGVASLLRRSRDLYVGGLYSYGSFSEAPAKSLNAVEVALAHRLGSRGSFQSLINEARERRLISEDDREHLHCGRKLRNRLVHASAATIWSPALAAEIVAASHRAVASLFPDG